MSHERESRSADTYPANSPEFLRGNIGEWNTPNRNWAQVGLLPSQVGGDKGHGWGPEGSVCSSSSCELQSLLLPAGGPLCAHDWQWSPSNGRTDRNEKVCYPIKVCNIRCSLHPQTTWSKPALRRTEMPTIPASLCALRRHTAHVTLESRSRLRPEQPQQASWMPPVPGWQLCFSGSIPRPWHFTRILQKAVQPYMDMLQVFQ